MRVRFIKKFGYILEGSTPILDDDFAKALIEKGIAIEIAEPQQQKAIKRPVKDKMVRRAKNKSHSDNKMRETQ